MVHPVGRRGGDHRRVKPAQPLFPRRGKGKEKRITSRARFPARPKRLGIETGRLRHFHSKLCWSPPIFTSKTPGSTTRLLAAPIKDKSSGVNSKDTRRLSPGCSETFANRFSLFLGGVTLPKRALRYNSTTSFPPRSPLFF